MATYPSTCVAPLPAADGYLGPLVQQPHVNVHPDVSILLTLLYRVNILQHGVFPELVEVLAQSVLLVVGDGILLRLDRLELLLLLQPHRIDLPYPVRYGGAHELVHHGQSEVMVPQGGR